MVGTALALEITPVQTISLLDSSERALGLAAEFEEKCFGQVVLRVVEL